MKILSPLLFIHSLVMLAAALVLVAAPEKIPATVNITVTPDQYLICYLLATAEFAIALLSFGAAYLKDKKALRLICLCFIAFHLSTATVELAVISEGGSLMIWANIALRIIISLLFFYFGRVKLRTPA
jgi:hypothetical protein